MFSVFDLESSNYVCADWYYFFAMASYEIQFIVFLCCIGLLSFAKLWKPLNLLYDCPEFPGHVAQMAVCFIPIALAHVNLNLITLLHILVPDVQRMCLIPTTKVNSIVDWL